MMMKMNQQSMLMMLVLAVIGYMLFMQRPKPHMMMVQTLRPGSKWKSVQQKMAIVEAAQEQGMRAMSGDAEFTNLIKDAYQGGAGPEEIEAIIAARVLQMHGDEWWFDVETFKSLTVSIMEGLFELQDYARELYAWVMSGRKFLGDAYAYYTAYFNS